MTKNNSEDIKKAKSELFQIILDGGEQNLMPERRFDQSIYFTMMNE